jgi:hypothetical protein
VFKPVFTEQPGSWREWWQAVRAFTARWYGLPAGEVTGHHADADELGRELGVTLSPSLHEWAAFTASLRRAGVWDRAMRDAPTLCWDEESESVLVMEDLEGTVRWGVQPEHLAEDDPPVQYCWDSGGGASPWQPWTPTTSQFALQHLIAYLRPVGGSMLLLNDVQPSPELLDRLRTAGRAGIELGGQLLVEDDELIVLAGKSPWSPTEEPAIDISVTIGPGRSGSVPEALADLARREGWAGSSGAFLDLRGSA